VTVTLQVVETVADNPVVFVALALLMRAGVAWQRELTWPEYRTLHGLRRLVFPWLQRLQPAGYGRWVSQKGSRDDAEFVATVQTDVRETAARLRRELDERPTGSLHLLSSIKRRPDTHGDPLSAAHVVWTHDSTHDGTAQTEAYLFRNSDGTTDVYAHYEASVVTPVDHLTEHQQDGDPRGIVAVALREPAAVTSEWVCPDCQDADADTPAFAGVGIGLDAAQPQCRECGRRAEP
jgi:hypothetical protein